MNFDEVNDLVDERVDKSQGQGHARSGCCRGRPGQPATRVRRGNFRRLVAEEKTKWRTRQPPRPAPGGVVTGRAPGHRLGRDGRAARVLRGARLEPVRFVRFARNERAETTLRLLAECFEVARRRARHGALGPDGLPQGGGGRQRGGADPGLPALGPPLRVPPGLLPGRGPGVQGDRGEPGRLRQGGSDDPGRHRSGTSRPRTRRPPRGASRSTVSSTPRPARSRSNGWSWNGTCSPRCRRCGPASAGWWRARLTGWPVCGSPRPATRCPPG